MDKNDETILSVINVNKRYHLNKQIYQALFDINLEFKKGELVSIIGESGSGKSTLMNLIGGLDSDYSGKIIVEKKDLKDLSVKELDSYRKNKIGFVFQSFNLIPHLSIVDNVTMTLTLSNIPEKEKTERATKLLESLGLKRQLKKKPTELSGGQRQRVAIARALINDPDIIIADEPTGALDSATSMQILKILKEVADSGKLVLMVTHSEKVASFSSRVIEIFDGRIVSDKKNEDYTKLEFKVEKEKSEENENLDKNLFIKEIRKDKKGAKHNLSIWSTLKLALLNMFASKTKNILLSIGIAFSIGSLILMLCFNSGITDYINNTLKSYSDPTIVTISKKNDRGSKSYEIFNQEEISNLSNEINQYLKEKKINFEVGDENIEYGFEAFTTSYGGVTVEVGYDFTPDLVSDYETMEINYLYTTPPTYKDDIVKGSMPTSEGGVMLTPACKTLFKDIDPIGKDVRISLTYMSNGITKSIWFIEKVTGIADTSVMSNYPILYINYDRLYNKILELANVDSSSPQVFLEPNIIYINTQNEGVANEINDFLDEKNEFIGSIEENIAGSFGELGSTVGASLTVISLVSIIISAIMIFVVMFMSVTERTKEIGVLKSIGARKSDIRRIFSAESLLLGVLSGALGLLLFGLFYLVAYFVLVHFVGIAPLSFRWYYLFIALGVSILISLLSGIYPANKASKLDPVEALRRE